MTAPRKYPPRERMLLAWEMRERGISQRHIASALQTTRGIVSRWFMYPERFDPYLDEVALERAREGDRAVYDRLTYYERDEFFRRLSLEIAAEPYDHLLHYPTNGSVMRGTRSTYWLHELEDRLGFSRGYLTKQTPVVLRRLEDAA